MRRYLLQNQRISLGQADENKEVKQDEQALTESELEQVAGGYADFKNYKSPFDDFDPNNPFGT